jgi:hypothetical protein
VRNYRRSCIFGRSQLLAVNVLRGIIPTRRVSEGRTREDVAVEIFPHLSLAHASGYEKPWHFAVVGCLGGKKRNFKTYASGWDHPIKGIVLSDGLAPELFPDFVVSWRIVNFEPRTTVHRLRSDLPTNGLTKNSTFRGLSPIPLRS